MDKLSQTRQTTPGAELSWVKSSLSFANGNCVEVASLPPDVEFRKAQGSHANGNCPEVASLPDGMVGVRDSKDPEGAILRFTRDEWRAFLGGVRNGEFDHFGQP
jgi:hypothetical protein